MAEGTPRRKSTIADKIAQFRSIGTSASTPQKSTQEDAFWWQKSRADASPREPTAARPQVPPRTPAYSRTQPPPQAPPQRYTEPDAGYRDADQGRPSTTPAHGPAAYPPNPAASAASAATAAALQRLAQEHPSLYGAIMSLERGPDGRLSESAMQLVNQALARTAATAASPAKPASGGGAPIPASRPPAVGHTTTTIVPQPSPHRRLAEHQHPQPQPSSRVQMDPARAGTRASAAAPSAATSAAAAAVATVAVDRSVEKEDSMDQLLARYRRGAAEDSSSKQGSVSSVSAVGSLDLYLRSSAGPPPQSSTAARQSRQQEAPSSRAGGTAHQRVAGDDARPAAAAAAAAAAGSGGAGQGPPSQPRGPGPSPEHPRSSQAGARDAMSAAARASAASAAISAAAAARSTAAGAGPSGQAGGPSPAPSQQQQQELPAAGVSSSSAGTAVASAAATKAPTAEKLKKILRLASVAGRLASSSAERRQEGGDAASAAAAGAAAAVPEATSRPEVAALGAHSHASESGGEGAPRMRRSRQGSGGGADLVSEPSLSAVDAQTAAVIAADVQGTMEFAAAAAAAETAAAAAAASQASTSSGSTPSGLAAGGAGGAGQVATSEAAEGTVSVAPATSTGARVTATAAASAESVGSSQAQEPPAASSASSSSFAFPVTAGTTAGAVVLAPAPPSASEPAASGRRVQFSPNQPQVRLYSDTTSIATGPAPPAPGPSSASPASNTTASGSATAASATASATTSAPATTAGSAAASAATGLAGSQGAASASSTPAPAQTQASGAAAAAAPTAPAAGGLQSVLLLPSHLPHGDPNSPRPTHIFVPADPRLPPALVAVPGHEPLPPGSVSPPRRRRASPGSSPGHSVSPPKQRQSGSPGTIRPGAPDTGSGVSGGAAAVPAPSGASGSGAAGKPADDINRVLDSDSDDEPGQAKPKLPKEVELELLAGEQATAHIERESKSFTPNRLTRLLDQISTFRKNEGERLLREGERLKMLEELKTMNIDQLTVLLGPTSELLKEINRFRDLYTGNLELVKQQADAHTQVVLDALQKTSDTAVAVKEAVVESALRQQEEVLDLVERIAPPVPPPPVPRSPLLQMPAQTLYGGMPAASDLLSPSWWTRLLDPTHRASLAGNLEAAAGAGAGAGPPPGQGSPGLGESWRTHPVAGDLLAHQVAGVVSAIRSSLDAPAPGPVLGGPEDLSVSAITRAARQVSMTLDMAVKEYIDRTTQGVSTAAPGLGATGYPLNAVPPLGLQAPLIGAGSAPGAVAGLPTDPWVAQPVQLPPVMLPDGSVVQQPLSAATVYPSGAVMGAGPAVAAGGAPMQGLSGAVATAGNQPAAVYALRPHISSATQPQHYHQASASGSLAGQPVVYAAPSPALTAQGTSQLIAVHGALPSGGPSGTALLNLPACGPAVTAAAGPAAAATTMGCGQGPLPPRYPCTLGPGSPGPGDGLPCRTDLQLVRLVSGSEQVLPAGHSAAAAPGFPATAAGLGSLPHPAMHPSPAPDQPPGMGVGPSSAGGPEYSASRHAWNIASDATARAPRSEASSVAGHAPPAAYSSQGGHQDGWSQLAAVLAPGQPPEDLPSPPSSPSRSVGSTIPSSRRNGPLAAGHSTRRGSSARHAESQHSPGRASRRSAARSPSPSSSSSSDHDVRPARRGGPRRGAEAAGRATTVSSMPGSDRPTGAARGSGRSSSRREWSEDLSSSSDGGYGDAGSEDRARRRGGSGGGSPSDGSRRRRQGSTHHEHQRHAAGGSSGTSASEAGSGRGGSSALPGKPRAVDRRDGGGRAGSVGGSSTGKHSSGAGSVASLAAGMAEVTLGAGVAAGVRYRAAPPPEVTSPTSTASASRRAAAVSTDRGARHVGRMAASGSAESSPPGSPSRAPSGISQAAGAAAPAAVPAVPGATPIRGTAQLASYHERASFVDSASYGAAATQTQTPTRSRPVMGAASASRLDYLGTPSRHTQPQTGSMTTFHPPPAVFPMASHPGMPAAALQASQQTAAPARPPYGSGPPEATPQCALHGAAIAAHQPHLLTVAANPGLDGTAPYGSWPAPATPYSMQPYNSTAPPLTQMAVSAPMVSMAPHGMPPPAPSQPSMLPAPSAFTPAYMPSASPVASGWPQPGMAASAAAMPDPTGMYGPVDSSVPVGWARGAVHATQIVPGAHPPASSTSLSGGRDGSNGGRSGSTSLMLTAAAVGHPQLQAYPQQQLRDGTQAEQQQQMLHQQGQGEPTAQPSQPGTWPIQRAGPSATPAMHYSPIPQARRAQDAVSQGGQVQSSSDAALAYRGFSSQLPPASPGAAFRARQGTGGAPAIPSLAGVAGQSEEVQRAYQATLAQLQAVYQGQG